MFNAQLAHRIFPNEFGCKAKGTNKHRGKGKSKQYNSWVDHHFTCPGFSFHEIGHDSGDKSKNSRKDETELQQFKIAITW